MTQEEKQLLLKDLCTRLPYGVKIIDEPANCLGKLFLISTTDMVEYETETDTGIQTIYNIKPYLRPILSMTEDEKKKLKDMHCLDNADALVSMKEQGAIDNPPLDFVQLPRTHSFDFMNSIHVDYRGLIEKGLALEAPKGMYKTD